MGPWTTLMTLRCTSCRLHLHAGETSEFFFPLSSLLYNADLDVDAAIDANCLSICAFRVDMDTDGGRKQCLLCSGLRDSQHSVSDRSSDLKNAPSHIVYFISTAIATSGGSFPNCQTFKLCSVSTTANG